MNVWDRIILKLKSNEKLKLRFDQSDSDFPLVLYRECTLVGFSYSMFDNDGLTVFLSLTETHLQWT